MELPPALAPWAPRLAIFPRELALSLGPLAARLASAIGPFPAPRTGEGSDPDGFDGLARRGSYERLLISDWLLAEEAPDEFLRRATMGEHGFLRLAHRAPAASRGTIALFDAGPEQIGAPRIAHIAALVALARRADAAGATFSWGVLQDEARALHDGVTPENVRRLLEARTAREAGEGDVEAWGRARRPGDRAPDDLWIVGGPWSARIGAPLAAARLVVREAAEPGARALHATVARAGETRSVTLPLPGPADAIRLLRDPFDAAPAPALPLSSAAPHAAVGGLTFGYRGVKLFARSDAGGVLVFTLPSSPRHAAQPPIQVLPGGGAVVTAVGWTGGATLVVIAGDKVVLQFRTRRGGIGSSLPFDAGKDAPTPGTPAGPLFPYLKLHASPGEGFHSYFLDGSGDLYGLAVIDGLRAARLATSVKAIAQLSLGQAAIVTHASERWSIASIDGGKAPKALIDVPGRGEAFFGFLGDGEPSSHGVLALEEGPRAFRVLTRTADRSLVAPTGTRVVGVMQQGGAPALLVLEDDERTLSALGARRAQRLLRSDHRVLSAACSTSSSHVALLTQEGEVLVYGLKRGRILLHSAAPLARKAT